MKVGIFFGGISREREVSFAGGRTIYDNLDKRLFEPVPIFIDSIGNFIHLDWHYIYKGTIRDFYPPAKYYPKGEEDYQLYIESLQPLANHELEEIINTVGEKVAIEKLPELMDFAFLALHGTYGEDGTIQGMLEWLGIPYSGSGILPSAIGIDKIAQKKLITAGTVPNPYTTFSIDEWKLEPENVIQKIQADFDQKVVIKSPRHGSSIGVSIVELSDSQALKEALDRSFFIREISPESWRNSSEDEKKAALIGICDIKSGLGLPLWIEGETFYAPGQLLNRLDEICAERSKTIQIIAEEHETHVLVEQFVKGREFSCIVIRNLDGSPVALPPTEIIKGQEIFDYRSKYLPGKSRKETPMRIGEAELEKIRSSCEALFEQMDSDVYARIDGFYLENGEIYLNDPNTTSGMMPSSFFFHQAAEIGLNPTQLITYIIQISLMDRAKSGAYGHQVEQLSKELSYKIEASNREHGSEKRVGVILGGYSSERHISVESGRNIFEKLSSSKEFDPTPLFLTGSADRFEIYQIPINLLLKDNADDIADLVRDYKHNKLIDKIREEASEITRLFSGKELAEPKKLSLGDIKEDFDMVFIALHGRPGEDGQLQKELEEFGIPFNGSSSESSSTTINKYVSNEILASHGILVPKHTLVEKENWVADPEKEIQRVFSELEFPLICKPADDGCSSAVKKIKNEAEFRAFAQMTFRPDITWPDQAVSILGLDRKEEFPRKEQFLVEELVDAKGAERFLEITGGMLTSYDQDGNVDFEIFEPSEALTVGDVLSLEEKFLAGEGQNITPARFGGNEEENKKISASVREVLKKTAEILNVQGYARIDAFVRIYNPENIEVIIIEVNSLPGMTPATCIFHQSAINGYKPIDFISQILAFGVQRQEKSLAV